MASDQYHLHLESLSRSKGRSAGQYSAYIAGAILKDKRLGKVHDKTSKEEVKNAMIYLPDSAPQSWKDELKACGNDTKKLWKFREMIWNSLEAIETRANANLGKKFDAAYPLELNEEQRKICREKMVKEFTSLGYIVDFADHMVNHNPHLQGLISTRQVVNNEERPWAPIKEVKAYVCESKLTGHRKSFKTVKELEDYNKRNREQYEKVPVINPKTQKQKLARRNEKVWLKTRVEKNPINDKQNLIKWRKDWEEAVNEFLPEDRKQTCLSYKTIGLNKKPKKHISYAGYKMGMKSDRVRENIQIEKDNEELARIEEALKEQAPREEDSREYEEAQEMSVEQLLVQVDDLDRMFHHDLLEDLGIEKKPKHKEPSIHISNGALNAMQREKEEEIEKFLKTGKDKDDEDERQN